MPQGDWLYDNSANKFNNTYFRDYNNTGFAVDMSGDLVVRGTIRNDDTGAVDMSGDLVVQGGDLVVRGSMDIEKPIDITAYGYGTYVMNFKTYYSPAFDKGTIKSAIISGVSDKQSQRTDNGYLAFATADSGALHQRMRIEKNGNVGIGTTNPTYTLYVSGSLYYSSGGLNGSDDRIKKNEVYITNALETISKLKPQKYDKYMTEDSSDNTLQLTDEFIEESGLIAQEVYYDVPELRHLVGVPEDADLSGNPIPTSSDPQMDPDYSNWGSKPAGLNYNGFIAYLIKGMQEQQEQIELLKTEVAALKNA